MLQRSDWRLLERQRWPREHLSGPGYSLAALWHFSAPCATLAWTANDLPGDSRANTPAAESVLLMTYF